MKKKILNHIGSGFTYGAVVGMLLFLFNTPSDAVFKDTMNVLLISAACAVVCGMIFTGMLFLADRIRAKRYDPYRQELSAEGTILLDDSARRLVMDKLVPGWLFLTEQSLSFFSSQKELRRIPMEEISSVAITDPKRGQITLSMTTMEVETFAVSDALAWFQAVGDLQKNEPSAQQLPAEEGNAE